MKKRVAIFLIVLVVLSAGYLLKRLHYHHYFKGKADLSLLREFEKVHQWGPTRPAGFVYVAHAGGSYAGKIYPNSLEALDNSYRAGVRYIEVDIHYTNDSITVLSHDYVNKSANDFLKDSTSGTHVSLNGFVQWLNDKDVKIITDVKVDNVKVLQKILQDYPAIERKLIPQVYTIAEIIQVKKLGYKNIIYTNYISVYPNPIIKELANSKILFGIALPYDRNFKLFRLFQNFSEFTTPIFLHTVNDPGVVEQLRQLGCKGVYSDTLLFAPAQ